jgi:hypothetical protein
LTKRERPRGGERESRLSVVSALSIKMIRATDTTHLNAVNKPMHLMTA